MLQIQNKKSKTQERQFYGKRIGEIVSLSDVGLAGYEGLITGGSDKQGFPMLKSVQGTARKRILMTKGTGLRKAKVKGVRIKKSVRGGKVSEEIQQLNIKITKEGSKKIDTLFGAAEKSEEKKEEAPKEEKKEEKKEGPKKEEKTEEVKEEPKEEKVEEPKEEAKPEEESVEEKVEEPAEEVTEEPAEEEQNEQESA